MTKQRIILTGEKMRKIEKHLLEWFNREVGLLCFCVKSFRTKRLRLMNTILSKFAIPKQYKEKNSQIFLVKENEKL